MERNTSEPVQECMVCEGLVALERPAGPVTIDGCLKMMSFQPHYPDSRVEYFAENSLFLEEARKAGWETLLQRHGVTKKDNGAEDGDADLRCARGAGRKNSRLASHGLEEAICTHNQVLMVSDMLENEH